MNTDEDSLDYTPQRMLQECIEEISQLESPPTKCLVILLWDEDGEYNTKFYNAGMKMSEAVSLCEIQKQTFINIISRD